jgi:hypothetical protein
LHVALHLRLRSATKPPFLSKEVGGSDTRVTTAEAVLLALAEGRDEDAWEHAQALATTVLDDPMTALARGVLEGGPFAMRKAEVLAEAVLGDAVVSEADEGADSKGR